VSCKQVPCLAGHHWLLASPDIHACRTAFTAGCLTPKGCHSSNAADAVNDITVTAKFAGPALLQMTGPEVRCGTTSAYLTPGALVDALLVGAYRAGHGLLALQAYMECTVVSRTQHCIHCCCEQQCVSMACRNDDKAGTGICCSCPAKACGLGSFLHERLSCSHCCSSSCHFMQDPSKGC
jgi:hypothetical protein